MRPVRRWTRRVGEPVLRSAARLRLNMARRRSTAHAAPLLDALTRHLSGAHTADERQWIDRIEAMRAALLSSQETITVVNYGAGRPGSTKSARAMRRGRTRTVSVADTCRQASKPPFWAQMLMVLVHDLRPTRCVELGTCLGVSVAYQAAGLHLAARHGVVVTLEGADELAELSRRNLAGLGLTGVSVVTGRFDETLPDVLDELGTVDYAFVDGHHDETATIAYFEQLLPHLTPGSVVVFDDIAWSEGMARAWTTIRGHPRVRSSVGLRMIGICVVGDPSTPDYQLDLFLP